MGTPRSFLSLEHPLDFKSNEAVTLSSFTKNCQQHIKVNRLDLNEEIHLLNGQGLFAVLKCTDSKKLCFQFIKLIKATPTTINIELCMAPPSSNALTESVNQATELGVSAFNMIKTQHGQNFSANIFKKTENAILSSCAQCHNAWAPKLSDQWHNINELLSDETYLHIFANENLALGHAPIGFTNKSKIDDTKKIRIYIGPEGGWSNKELEELAQKAEPLCLGGNILRVPTAVTTSIFYILQFAHSKNLS